MKKIFVVLTFIGICLGAFDSSAQSDSTASGSTNMKSTHHDAEHHGGKGHHRGFRLFHHKHYGRHSHPDQGKRHNLEQRDSKDKQDQNKK